MLHRGSPGMALVSCEGRLYANCLEGRGEFHGAIKALGPPNPGPQAIRKPPTGFFAFLCGWLKGVFAELANRSPNSYLLSEVRAELLELQGETRTPRRSIARPFDPAETTRSRSLNLGDSNANGTSLMMLSRA